MKRGSIAFMVSWVLYMVYLLAGLWSTKLVYYPTVYDPLSDPCNVESYLPVDYKRGIEIRELKIEPMYYGGEDG